MNISELTLPVMYKIGPAELVRYCGCLTARCSNPGGGEILLTV
jgi:hypothetical protein